MQQREIVKTKSYRFSLNLIGWLNLTRIKISSGHIWSRKLFQSIKLIFFSMLAYLLRLINVNPKKPYRHLYRKTLLSRTTETSARPEQLPVDPNKSGKREFQDQRY